MGKMSKKAMIVSVGTGMEGKDIAHGICFSIKHQNPDLLVFLNTEESRKITMPYIAQECKTEGRPWEELNLSDPNDVENITLECERIIGDLSKRGYELRNIVVDYTSGTKAMSAGLTIASIRKRVGSLSYVTGKRGEGGRVISGTERILSILPNQIVATDLLEEAIQSFNTYHFDVSTRLLDEARDLLSESDFLKRIEILKHLSKAYGAWDRFDVKEAFQLLRELPHKFLLKEWKISEQVELNKEALYQEKENVFCPERICDLLENAKRRGEEERKFDDAVARLYRTCECIAQFEINKLGLYKEKEGKPDPSNLDLSKLSPQLEGKYSKYTDPVDGKTKLPLKANYILLQDLGRPVGIFFKEQEDKFNELMGIRNLSILAHGFNPVSERVYRDLLALVENLMEHADLSKPRILKKVRFPKIIVENFHV